MFTPIPACPPRVRPPEPKSPLPQDRTDFRTLAQTLHQVISEHAREIDELRQAIAAIEPGDTRYFVDSLPDVDEADAKGLYFVPRDTVPGGDLYDEWTVVEKDGVKRWERFGGGGGQEPSDYGQVKAQVQGNTVAIAEIEGKIPGQASAQNQLADEDFVNSSIATNTANFLGTYSYTTNLGFPQPASAMDVDNAAIATKLGTLAFAQTPTNNDYVFVSINYAPTTDVDEFRRFKFNGTAWGYEFTLNNSSFTAAQWAAINSGITAAAVEKLRGIAAGAQVNVVETVKVNGVALTPDANKAVDVPAYQKPQGGIPDGDLASGTDLAVLRQFYLEEKRKIDPRFGVANNVSVVIGGDGNRYEVTTEGSFVPTTYGQGVYAEEIYLAPSVNAIGEDVDAAFTYTRKIVCYGNITSISRWAFSNAYHLNFLSLAGSGQTDAVANGNVDFSMCDNAILVVIPDTYYQDETSAFWNWADYDAQGAGGVNHLRMCNFAKASNPRRNPYIVEASYALSDGEQEKYFIIPDYQWDVKWAKRWGENYSFPEGEEIGSIALNDICGMADVQYNNRATLSRPSVSMGYVQTFSANCPLPSGFDSHYGGVTIVAVVSGFNGHAANVNFGGMKIQRRMLQILDPSGNEVFLFANSIGERLTSFVFRANRAGASFQWLLNLGRSIFTTPDEWADMGDYDFISDGMSIACDNGMSPFYFHALRIYNAFLTDAQIMALARLDAERFNLTEEY